MLKTKRHHGNEDNADVSNISVHERNGVKQNSLILNSIEKKTLKPSKEAGIH